METTPQTSSFIILSGLYDIYKYISFGLDDINKRIYDLSSNIDININNYNILSTDIHTDLTIFRHISSEISELSCIERIMSSYVTSAYMEMMSTKYISLTSEYANSSYIYEHKSSLITETDNYENISGLYFKIPSIVDNESAFFEINFSNSISNSSDEIDTSKYSIKIFNGDNFEDHAYDDYITSTYSNNMLFFNTSSILSSDDYDIVSWSWSIQKDTGDHDNYEEYSNCSFIKSLMSFPDATLRNLHNNGDKIGNIDISKFVTKDILTAYVPTSRFLELSAYYLLKKTADKYFNNINNDLNTYAKKNYVSDTFELSAMLSDLILTSYFDSYIQSKLKEITTKKSVKTLNYSFDGAYKLKEYTHNIASNTSNIASNTYDSVNISFNDDIVKTTSAKISYVIYLAWDYGESKFLDKTKPNKHDHYEYSPECELHILFEYVNNKIVELGKNLKFEKDKDYNDYDYDISIECPETIELNDNTYIVFKIRPIYSKTYEKWIIYVSYSYKYAAN